MPGGGWPGTADAVRSALWAVRRHVLGPVVTIGHSAGGHLAVLAVSGTDPVPVTGIIALAGVLNVHLAHQAGLDGDASAALLGALPQAAPGRWQQADPAMQRHHVPARLVHGDADVTVPLDQSTSWMSSRGRGDASAQLQVLSGTEHFALIDPQAPAFAALCRAIDELTDGHVVQT